jgi:CO/xanthine dehydrogenase FAD-binding subunit
VDLATVTEFAAAAGTAWRDGDAYLGGGTWLLSEPQPGTTRLLDLTSYDWPPLTETDDGLAIAATCTLAELSAWRPAPHRDWPAALALPGTCCDALLGSFKVQNVATVGGNLCLSLPAGPMIALAAALDGIATILRPAGAARVVPVTGFVTGVRRNVLLPGELLRSVFLPAAALRRPAACRQVSLSAAGRSAVLLIGTLAPEGDVQLTLTAAVPRPVQLRLPLSTRPNETATALTEAVAAATGDETTRRGGTGAGAVVVATGNEASRFRGARDATASAGDGPAVAERGYLDDVHGSGWWRRVMAERAAAQVIAELAAAGPAG